MGMVDMEVEKVVQYLKTALFFVYCISNFKLINHTGTFILQLCWNLNLKSKPQGFPKESPLSSPSL